MTRQEIWTEAVSHAVNLPQDTIKQMVAFSCAMTPKGKWDEEIHGEELEMWRSERKAEAPQIKEWIFNCLRIYGTRNGIDPNYIEALINFSRPTL